MPSVREQQVLGYADYVKGSIDWEIPEDGELPDGLPTFIALTLDVDEDGQILDIIDEDIG